MVNDMKVCDLDRGLAVVVVVVVAVAVETEL